MSRSAVIALCLMLVLAGCGSTVESTEPPSTDAATGTEMAEQSSDFEADYSRSIQKCGPTCWQVNVSVDLTYTGDEDRLRYPTVSLSAYVLDDGFLGWGEPERKDIWTEYDSVDNISRNETVTFDDSFKIRIGEAITIRNADCTVYGGVQVDYAGQTWNQTNEFELQSDQCEN